MKTVRISDEVYAEVARRGRFGENVDDVLRRELHVLPGVRTMAQKRAARTIYAERKMTPRIVERGLDEFLQIRFEGGIQKEWPLPNKNDTAGLGAVLKGALDFATNEGGTEGQLKYIRKELNESGYYLRGRRR